MYQLHFDCGDEQQFEEFASSVHARVASSPNAKVLVHLFNDTAQHDVTDKAIAVLGNVLPEATYVGCSTSGNICDGALVRGKAPNLSAVVNVFEHDSTCIEVHQFSLTRENRNETGRAILNLVKERPWVKAIEMLTTLIDVGMSDFCDNARYLRDDVIVFGGGALSTETVNMWAGLPYVFSSAGESSGGSIVVVLYGGPDFHAKVETVYGWKPLGRRMRITKTEGPVLYELDGVPAFDRFRHYLSVDNDEAFSQNALIFPLAIDHGGQMVIKAPVFVDEQGAITLTSDLAPYHQTCRIAYGDPGIILQSIKESVLAIQEFEPQGITAFSCAARRLYWGDDDISRETLPLQDVAPTAGFYTGGEFVRSKGMLLHHNVTLVIAAMREGEASGQPKGAINFNESEFTRQMSIVSSLASFVGVTSSELEDAYAQLKVVAKTDGLTGLCNRREIESRIVDALEQEDPSVPIEPPVLIMLDIDDFKQVNDTYGHKAGDDVLRGIGSLLLSRVDEAGKGSSGRWGGEEFMVLLPSCTLEAACLLADELRKSFAAVNFADSGKHTVSVGVAQALPDETPDSLCQRADNVLYAAKNQGKDCVVVA